jgi:hypothetical protein
VHFLLCPYGEIIYHFLTINHDNTLTTVNIVLNFEATVKKKSGIGAENLQALTRHITLPKDIIFIVNKLFTHLYTVACEGGGENISNYTDLDFLFKNSGDVEGTFLIILC